jgi:hypothetical protein
MREFLNTWGTLIIAIYAAIQPWLTLLWKKIFKRGRIDIHETSKIEIGYSGLGATVALFGTLRAIHEDQFVKSIELIITRKKDNYSRKFEWGIFRAQTYTVGAETKTSFELPAGYMLLTSQPQRYNIQFYDEDLQREFRPILQPIAPGWTTFLREHIGPLQDIGIDIAKLLPTVGTEIEDIYREFNKEPFVVEAFTAIDRLDYWRAGTYALEMVVKTARPDEEFRRKWNFELSAQDEKQLRLNCVVTFRELCKQPIGAYYFAYCDYLTPTS